MQTSFESLSSENTSWTLFIHDKAESSLNPRVSCSVIAYRNHSNLLKNLIDDGHPKFPMVTTNVKQYREYVSFILERSDKNQP